MSFTSEGRPPSVSRWPAEAQWAIRWVSTNNPFYVISAGLFLVGLWLSFGDPRNAEDPFKLMVGLTCYTSLLACTAVILIRFAKVWDDARTVLLLLVLMFLATSVTFDHVIVFEVRFGMPMRGILGNVAGLVVAVAASEAVLHLVRLRFPMAYRVPYYIILALFFIYPISLAPYLNEPRSPAMMWRLFGFSSMAALAFLTLLPAVRQGASYVHKNGSPWPWPLYPWALFGLLALAVPGRAILLCYSMHLIDVADLYDMTFGPYFLVPFGLVLCVLLLEAGIVNARPRLMGAALALPTLQIAMSTIGHRSETIYRQFLTMFTDTMNADPVYCSFLAVASYYLYATVRRVPYAAESLTGSLAMLTFVSPNVLREGLVTPPQPAALIAASSILLGLGVWRRNSWNCLAGCCGLAVGVALSIPSGVDAFAYRWVIAFHLILLATVALAWTFDDDLSRYLRNAGPFLALVYCIAVIFLPLEPPFRLPDWLSGIYPIAIAIMIGVLGLLVWHPPTMVMAAIILASWFTSYGWQSYRTVRTWVVGFDYLVLSFLVFALAVLISLAKSGIITRWWRPQPEEASE
jgi:hypothetical protein